MKLAVLQMNDDGEQLKTGEISFENGKLSAVGDSAEKLLKEPVWARDSEGKTREVMADSSPEEFFNLLKQHYRRSVYLTLKDDN